MTDTFSRSFRSAIMRAVKSRDTTPEMAIRKVVHGLGYRYRLHDPSLPGTPDLVFRKRKKVIFVHGCFWHRHTCRQGRSLPASRQAYWKAKFLRNQARDLRTRRELMRIGYRCLIVWECQTRDLVRVAREIRAFLGP